MGRWRNGIRSTLKMSSGKPGAGSSPARPTIRLAPLAHGRVTTHERYRVEYPELVKGHEKNHLCDSFYVSCLY